MPKTPQDYLNEVAKAKQQVDGTKEDGTFFSGNLLSKGLDLISIPNYAAAGAADAALGGENPLSGAMKGIHDRASFIDTFEHHSMPKWAAIPLGLAVDIAVPGVPLGIGAKAKHAGDVAELIERTAVSAEHSIADIAEEAARMAGQSSEGAAKGMGVAARAAMERADARTMMRRAYAKAAKEKLPVNDVLVRDFGMVPEELDDLSKWDQLVAKADPDGRWERTLGGAKDFLVRPIKQVLRENPLFEGVGAKMAGAMDILSDVRQRVAGESLFRAKNILKTLGKDKADNIAFQLKMHRDLDDDTIRFWLQKNNIAANWRGGAHVDDAVKQARKLFDEFYEANSKKGVHQVFKYTTMLFKRLRPEEQSLALAYLKDPTAMTAAGTAPAKVVAFVKHALGEGSHYDEAMERFVAPLVKKKNYFPLMLTPDAMRVAKQEDLKAIRTVLADMGYAAEEATAVAEQIVMDRLGESDDIMKALQHNRGSTQMFDVTNLAGYEHDVEKILMKAVGDNADLIASAHAFGGRHQGFRAMTESYLTLHGLNGKDPKAIVNAHPEIRGGFDLLNKAYQSAIGNEHSALDPALSALGKLSDTLFLGPKTILLQISTLANSAGMSGIGRSLAGLAHTVSDPSISAHIERLGATTLPNIMNMSNSGTADLLSRLREWNPILKGVSWADRGQRTAAAVAGGVHMLDLERELKAASPERAAEIVREFMEVYGINVGKDSVLSREALIQGMQNIVKLTNFTGDAQALPKVFRGPAGKFFMKFKQYSFQQSYFIDKLVQEGAFSQFPRFSPRYSEAGRQRFLRYVAMFPWVYKHIATATNALRSEEHQVDPHSNPAEYVRNMMMMGWLGYMGDVAAAMSSKSEALGLGVVAGPNTSLLLKGAHAGVGLVRGDGASALTPVTPQAIKQGANLWENLN